MCRCTKCIIVRNCTLGRHGGLSCLIMPGENTVSCGVQMVVNAADAVKKYKVQVKMYYTVRFKRYITGF